MQNTVLELTVSNHSGVMSHITGLFSRRGFNLEGILCGKIGNGEKSKIFLLVNKNETLEQIQSQLEKLYDIHEIKNNTEADISIFDKVGSFFS